MQYTIEIPDNLAWAVGAARMSNQAQMEGDNAVANSDAEFLQWVMGKEVARWAERAKPPVVIGNVPQSVTRRQARQALIMAGLFDQVQPAIDAIVDAQQRALMQSEWDDSQMFERNRPALITMATALGLSSAQVDDLFRAAAAL
jgi:hypothetical protein